jgi:uncharacterized RDD family membrane protein YckC
MDVIDVQKQKVLEIDGMTIFQDRLRHWAIDYVIISVITLFLFFNFVKESTVDLSMWSTWFIVYFVYYMLFEFVFNRTPGKFLNKTKLFDSNEGKINIVQVLIRTIIRIIPMQHYLIRSLKQRTLHDILSKTYVMRVKRS